MARSGVFGRALGTARKGAGCRVHFMVSCHLRDALPPAPLVATGVDADGHARSSGSRWPRSRTVPGVWRSCASWSLRGPTGVQLLIISDAYRGLAAAVESTPPRAGWQRCRTHYLRNLLPEFLSPSSCGRPHWCAPSSTSRRQRRPRPSTPTWSLGWRPSTRTRSSTWVPPRRPVGLHADGHRPRSRRIRVC